MRSLKRLSATISRRATCTASVRGFAPSTFTASSARSVSSRIEVMLTAIQFPYEQYIHLITFVYINLNRHYFASRRLLSFADKRVLIGKCMDRTSRSALRAITLHPQPTFLKEENHE